MIEGCKVFGIAIAELRGDRGGANEVQISSE